MTDKKMLIAGAMLVALAAVGGIAYGSFAQDGAVADSAGSYSCPGGMGGGGWYNLSDDERAALAEEREARRSAVEAALAAGDYTAWQAAVGENNPMYGKISEENFPKLVQAHNYFANGRALMAELGIEKGFGQGMGKFHGRGQMWR